MLYYKSDSINFIIYPKPRLYSRMARLSPKRLVIGFIAIGVLIFVSVYLFNSLNWREGLLLRMGSSYEVLSDPVDVVSPLKLVPETDEEKEEEKRGFLNNGFNQYISDRLPLDRAVPDTRDTR